jgi:hypothetical protein
MASPFYGARLKIERAKHHISELYHAAQLFGDTHAHTITVETDPDTGNDVLRIAPAEPLPDKLLLVLGDALHNLRSTLDHAWCEMCVVVTPYTKFPVRETRDGVEAAINGLKENACEEVKRFIVDAVQPYKGGKGEMILNLHDLDIEDKHRLLIAHSEYTLITGMTAIDDRGEEFVIDDWLIVPPHIASLPIVGHRHFKITKYGTARIHVTFGEGMPLQGKFILPTLLKLTELVSRTVDCFEVIYLNRKP